MRSSLERGRIAIGLNPELTLDTLRSRVKLNERVIRASVLRSRLPLVRVVTVLCERPCFGSGVLGRLIRCEFFAALQLQRRGR